MESRNISQFFCFLLLFVRFACVPPLTAALDLSEPPHRTYIVHLQLPNFANFAGLDQLQSWYKSFLSIAIGNAEAASRMVHMYNHVITGFAVRLTEEEVSILATMDSFIHAYPDSLHSLYTTHTPDFLGLQLGTGLWSNNNLGEGIIIGVLDTGIHPDHPSFSGEGMPPPPAKWKGKCEFNHPTLCNNKLIGARTFLSGAAAMKGDVMTTAAPPTDDIGHGTHTASTAAGAFVTGAEVLGNAMGTAVGMAPRAHLAMYKVCTTEDCADSDILAAMDAAVSDGVDVLSLSLGTPSVPFHSNSVALGAFGAIQKGVFVSCAAGNSGPNASTLSNEAPWVLTVAASTIDRRIAANVKLGNGLKLDGESIFQPATFEPAMYPLVYPGAGTKPDAAFCGNGTLDARDITGKIVLCEVGREIAGIDLGVNVKKAGGIGMILMNGVADGFSSFADEVHVLPASRVSNLDGTKIKTYINSTSHPTAAILFRGTVLGTYPAPAIASFSSRGPSRASPGILKPDITGPGVNILAARPSPYENTSTSATFAILCGTSMSAPHLSGIAALIKSAHPSWSPAAIKSAIMTTADILDYSGKPIVDETLHPANLFAVGAGHVNPERASDPGLVYDLSADDYIPYLCGLGYTDNQVGAIAHRSINCSMVNKITEGELNYPSFSVALGRTNTSVSVARTVKNVGQPNSAYWVKVDAPAGVSVVVAPTSIQFSQVNQEQEFRVTFNGNGNGTAMESSHGYLSWISSKLTVRSPISVSFIN